MRVAIVEDDRKLRETYVQIIREISNYSCVGSFGDCESMIASIDSLRPDIVLMDIGLPGMSGIEGVKQIKALYPSTELVMLTIYDDDDRIFESICAGATGYILKNSRPADLVAAITQIRAGAVMSPSIAKRVLNFVRQAPPAPEDDFNLSSREIDILHLVVDGCSDKMIAEKLFISSHTVNSHLKHIYEKLQVHSKSQAVSTALKHRLV